MLGTPQDVLDRLTELVEIVSKQIALETRIEQMRYLKSSYEILAARRRRLSIAIASSNSEEIRFSLRSIADMTKGLSDVGADFFDEGSQGGISGNNISVYAHQVELSMR